MRIPGPWIAFSLGVFGLGTAAYGVLAQPVTNPPVTLGDLPQPANSLPDSENTTPAIGYQVRYAREDHVHPRISRAATATTDASGNWSVTWSTALAATPVVLPIPVNAGSQPISCNVITRTTTGATGRCWAGVTTLLNLSIITSGLTLNGFGSAASTTVQVLAIPPTQ